MGTDGISTEEFLMIALVCVISGVFFCFGILAGYHLHNYSEPTYITQCMPKECVCKQCPKYDVVNETIQMIEELEDIEKNVKTVKALVNTDEWRRTR